MNFKDALVETLGEFFGFLLNRKFWVCAFIMLGASTIGTWLVSFGGIIGVIGFIASILIAVILLISYIKTWEV